MKTPPSQIRTCPALRAIAIVIAALITLSGCSKSSASAHKSPPPVPVTVARVEQKNVPIQLHAIGAVASYSTVSVESRVDDKLLAAHFNQGDEVSKGQLLFTLDPAPFQAVLDAAQAQLERDQANMRQAENDEQRYYILLKKGVGSRQQYDQAHAAAGELRAAVAQDKANVEAARLNLSYTKIYSPITGRTGELKLYPGNLVKANDTSGVIVVINQVKPIYVDFSLPESDLPEVRRYRAQHPIQVMALPPNQNVAPAHGMLAFIDNAVNTSTGTITMRGMFPNEEERLWPGEFVNVTLTLGEYQGVLIVPSQAVETGQQGQYVYVVDDKMAAKLRPVRIGDVVNGETVINQGLKKGEVVVTDGQVRIAPGAKVVIKKSLIPQQAGAAS